MTSKELTPNVPRDGHKPRITRRLSKVIDALADGTCKTQRAACERFGMNEAHLSRMLARPQIRGVLRERAARTVAMGAPRAAARLIELLDGTSEHVAADVARHVLAIEGIKPSERPAALIINNVAAGYVVVAPDRFRNQAPAVEGEVIEFPSQEPDE